jgi:hypothetical protein
MRHEEVTVGRYKEVKRLFWTLMLIVSILGTDVFPKEWNGIVPCVSTRSVVEKRLGKDSFPAPDVLGSFRYKNSRVSIYYQRKNGAAPSTDIVQMIRVYPDKLVLLAEYVRKMSDFPSGFVKREMDPKITHINYLAYYFNAADRFEIEVQKNDDDKEIITSFGYYGLDADCSKHLPVSLPR